MRIDPHATVRALAAGRCTVTEFRELLARHGTPLVERFSDEEVDVTFVHELAEEDPARGDHGTEVRLRELVGSGPTGDRLLEPVADTSFRVLTVRMRSDVRLAYVFTVHRGAAAPELVPDPFNPPPVTSDTRIMGSVLALPDAAVLPLDPLRLAGGTPSLREHTLTSTVLGAQRPFWVSTPPGWSREDAPVPCVIVFDGTAGHTAPAVRDALVRQGQARDVVVVLVDQIGRRDLDLTADPNFSRMLAHELVPWLREHYGISPDPRDVALSGSSFGGLCAAWTALQHPGVFGNALIQSPSCWFHPDLPSLVRPAAPDQAEVVGATPATPTLIEAFATTEPAPIRIFHECGRVEHGPPPARIPQVFGNRWLHDVLRLKGYDTTYREYAGGHDATWWRATWADGLRWLFPVDPDPAARLR